jgi:hypothetical protein
MGERAVGGDAQPKSVVGVDVRLEAAGEEVAGAGMVAVGVTAGAREAVARKASSAEEAARAEVMAGAKVLIFELHVALELLVELNADHGAEDVGEGLDRSCGGATCRRAGRWVGAGRSSISKNGARDGERRGWVKRERGEGAGSGYWGGSGCRTAEIGRGRWRRVWEGHGPDHPSSSSQVPLGSSVQSCSLTGISRFTSCFG